MNSSLFASQNRIFILNFLRSSLRALFSDRLLGYLVIPDTLLQPFNTARAYLDGGVSLLPQLAMADFIASGEFARHVRKMRKLYQERREILFSCIHQNFGEQLQRIVSDGGMHAVFLIPDDYCDVEICKQARKKGLGIRTLSSHYLRESKNGLIIGFSGFNQNEISQGITTLKTILSSKK